MGFLRALARHLELRSRLHVADLFEDIRGRLEDTMSIEHDPQDPDRPFLEPLARLGEDALEQLTAFLRDLEELERFTVPQAGPSFYVAYVGEVDRMTTWLYEHRLLVPFDWPRWTEGRGLTPADIASRPVADAMRMLTALHRSDRFNAGALGAALDSGLVQACLRRVRAHIQAR